MSGENIQPAHGTSIGTVVICTALDIEYNAVRAHLEGPFVEREERGTLYEVGTFPTDRGHWEVALTQTGPGNTSAAVQLERAVARFQPQVVLFVGVAGGLKDVALGDVVIADFVYDYETGKDTPTDYFPRIKTAAPSYRLLERAKKLAREWLPRIQPTSPDTAPLAWLKPIAAGSKVLADQHSAIAKFLHKYCSDAVAVEMEGHGFLHGAYVNAGVDALVIRGISDLLSGKTATADRHWQPVAARYAAAFAFELLTNLPPQRTEADDPVIASVRLEPGADLVVDADPPRGMVSSDTVHVITLEARTTRAVVLHAARPVIVSRRLPRPACFAWKVGASVQPRHFTTDFDVERPQMRAQGVDFPFSISATDVEQFWFEPTSRTHEISWHLELDWTCEGRSGTTVIDNNGEPFEFYPRAALYDGKVYSVLHSGCDVRHVQGCPRHLLRKAGLPTSLWNSSSSKLLPYSMLSSLSPPPGVDTTAALDHPDAAEDLRRRILALGAEIGASDPNLPDSWPEYRRVASLVRVLFASPDSHRNHEPKAFRALLSKVLRYLYVSDQCQPGVIIGRKIHADWLNALGDDHPDTLAAAENLAGCLVGFGKSDEARDLYADLLSRYERTLGKNHPTTLTTASNLGAALGGLHKYQEAREQFETVVRRSQRAPGPDDPNTLRAANNLAAVLRFLGDLDAAQARAEDTLARYRRTLGNDHPETLHAMKTTATIQRSIGEIDRAEELEKELRARGGKPSID